MAFRHAANVRQTYTPAILAPFFCSVCSSEYLKYTLELVGRNRLSFVMHGQYHALILQIGFDPDRGVGAPYFTAFPIIFSIALLIASRSHQPLIVVPMT